MQAKIFALAIAAPGELRQRLIERYDPSSRALRHEMTINAHVPINLIKRQQAGKAQVEEPAIGLVLFPTLVPPKGELSDNFVLRMASGEPVPVLSHPDLQLVARVLRTLLVSAYQSPAGQTLEEVYPEAIAAEHAALAEIVQTACANTGAQCPVERPAALTVKNPRCFDSPLGWPKSCPLITLSWRRYPWAKMVGSS